MLGMSLLEHVRGTGGVLAYHGVGEELHAPIMHVTPDRLREQLTMVARSHQVVALSELLARWAQGRSTRGLVAVTFDDAYAGVARWAVPVLRDLGMPATIFVAAGPARSGGAYWWDVAELDRLAHREEAWVDLPSRVGVVSLRADDVNVMATVREHVLGLHCGRWPEPLARRPESDPWRSLTYDELRVVAQQSDGIDFGVHTLTHPVLPLLPHDEQVHEMRECLEELRLQLPRVLPVVAYPYGLYDRTTIRAARDAGLWAGFTMEARSPGPAPSMFTIPRIGVGNNRSARAIELRLRRVLRPAFVARSGSVHPRLPERIIRPVDVASSAMGSQ
jgi:peptidoglycan/xylan/chitin deacetylase (PgdA/CDA1 family)